MVNKKTINEFVNLVVLGLRHRIGSIVNDNELYSQKYAKDAEIFFNEAKKIIIELSFNVYEKEEISRKIKDNLKQELSSKTFLKERKFEIMDEETAKVLKDFGIRN